MPNVLQDTHFIEHWIDQGDWLAAADALRTGFYLFLTLKTTLASLWSAICVSVCAVIWKEKAPVCLEVRSGVQYKCFGSSWTQRRTSGINSSRRKKLFPSALNWQRIRFIQGAGLSKRCVWVGEGAVFVRGAHAPGLWRLSASITAAKSSHFSFNVLVLWPQGLDLKFVIDLIITGRFPLEFN